MTERDAKQAIQRLRDRIAELPTPDLQSDLISSIVGQVPVIGAPLMAWLTHGQREVAAARLEEVLWAIHDHLAGSAKAGTELYTDEDYLEFLTRFLPLAVHTRNEEKRRRFAALLAQAATTNEPEAREQAGTMAILLSQLEYAHVRLLDIIMNLPASQNHDGLWGSTRRVDHEKLGTLQPKDGAALRWLYQQGLLAGEMFTEGNVVVEKKGPDLQVTPLGLAFHKWITPESRK